MEAADGDLEPHYQALHQDNRRAIWKGKCHLVSHVTWIVQALAVTGNNVILKNNVHVQCT